MKILHINSIDSDPHRRYVAWLGKAMEREVTEQQRLVVDDVEAYCEQQGVDLLVFSAANDRHDIQHRLDQCRTLRLPYMFLLPSMRKLQPLRRLLLPVTMLEEEIYKAQLAGTLVRRTGCRVCLLPAHDYGSKAQQNADKIATALAQTQADVVRLEAMKDSFHLYKEVTDRQKDFLSDMIFWTASRDYGLDDLLFGPPERKIIMQSQVPVMLVSPRADLFSLCD